MFFDGDWKDYGTGFFWVAQLSRLNEAGIPVVCVAGNHDAASEVGRRLRLPPNVSQLSAAKPETKRFDHLDFAVIGQSYATRSVTSDLAATYPPVDPGLFTIGLLSHQPRRSTRARVVRTDHPRRSAQSRISVLGSWPRPPTRGHLPRSVGHVFGEFTGAARPRDRRKGCNVGDRRGQRSHVG